MRTSPEYYIPGSQHSVLGNRNPVFVTYGHFHRILMYLEMKRVLWSWLRLLLLTSKGYRHCVAPQVAIAALPVCSANSTQSSCIDFRCPARK